MMTYQTFERSGLDPYALYTYSIFDGQSLHSSSSCDSFKPPFVQEFFNLGALLESGHARCTQCRIFVSSSVTEMGSLISAVYAAEPFLVAADRFSAATEGSEVLQAAFEWVREVTHFIERDISCALGFDEFSPLRSRVGDALTLPLRLPDSHIRALMAALGAFSGPFDDESKVVMASALLTRQDPCPVVMVDLPARGWALMSDESSSFEAVGDFWGRWASSQSHGRFLVALIERYSGDVYTGMPALGLLQFFLRALLHERRGCKLAFIADDLFVAFHKNACYRFSLTAEDSVGSLEVLDRLLRDRSGYTMFDALDLLQISRKL